MYTQLEMVDITVNCELSTNNYTKEYSYVMYNEFGKAWILIGGEEREKFNMLLQFYGQLYADIQNKLSYPSLGYCWQNNKMYYVHQIIIHIIKNCCLLNRWLTRICSRNTLIVWVQLQFALVLY